MEIKIRNDKNKMEIFSDVNNVTFTSILIALSAMGAGIGAVYIGYIDNIYFPVGIGVFFFFRWYSPFK